MPSRTSRRVFLKGVGAAGLAAGVFPSVIPSTAFGANDRMGIALLGAGGRGRSIISSALTGGNQLVACCDVDPKSIAALKAGGKAADKDKDKKVALYEKAKVYEDYRKLLAEEKGVDAVVIAAGQRWHMPMSKAAMLAGKHVFCEKPLAHSCVEAREMRELGKQTKLATLLGSQGGSSDTFRKSMEIIQAGLLGQIREVHCWITRSFPPSAAIDQNADPIPEGLNWDFWCGPSPLLPFKKYYLGGCLAWGRWLDFGDGHLADMGAHGLNLPWRALKLTAPIRCEVKHPEPLKDSYPSATTFKWDFAAREGMDPVSVYWHDGTKAGPPEGPAKALEGTYGKVPSNACLFVGEKGLLKSDAWGVGGVIKLNADAKFRGVNDHEAAKAIPVTLPRNKGNHMEEWTNAARTGGKTFQAFDTAGMVAEMAMVGIVAMRLGRPIEWDSEAMKVKGATDAEKWVHLAQRKKWL